MAARREKTVSHEAGRFVAAFSVDTFEVWRIGRLRDRCLATFPHTPEGSRAGLALLATKSPAVRELSPPGRAFVPARFLHIAPAAAVTAIVVAAAAGGGVALASSHHSGGAELPTASGGPSGGQSDAQTGWVYGDSSGAAFLTWTRTGDSVSGSLQTDGLDTSSQTSLTPMTAAFTGTIAGGGFTLAFPQGFGTVTNVAGQLRGRDLVISFPQNGALVPLTLTPGTATAYNADVAQLQGVAASNGAAQAQASQAAASASAQATVKRELDQQTENAAQALAAAVTQLDSDASTLANDKGNLNQDTSMASADLATTQHDAQVAEQEAKQEGSNDGQACSDAGQAGSDAGGVQSDQGGLMSTVAGINNDQGAVTNDRSALAAAETSWHQFQAQDPGIGASDAPSYAAVSAALTAGAAALSTSQAEVSAANATVSDDVSKANAAAAAANSAGNC